MRREVRATANRLANFDDANLRRSARAAVAAGARVHRAWRSSATRSPTTSGGRGAAAGAQAGLARGARPAGPAADDQGRRRRPDPPPAGDGRQAGAGPRHPGHGGQPHARHARRMTRTPQMRIASSAPATSGCRWRSCSSQHHDVVAFDIDAPGSTLLRDGRSPIADPEIEDLPRPPRPAADLHHRPGRGLRRRRVRRHRHPDRLRPGDQLLRHLAPSRRSPPTWWRPTRPR